MVDRTLTLSATSTVLLFSYFKGYFSLSCIFTAVVSSAPNIEILDGPGLEGFVFK